MDTMDLVNGLFELLGAFMLALNVRKLHTDKLVRGVSWGPTGFFAAWGLWNIFYYPHLGQWFSFTGGVLLVAVNIIWCGQMIYYTRLERAPILEPTQLSRYLKALNDAGVEFVRTYELADDAVCIRACGSHSRFTPRGALFVEDGPGQWLEARIAELESRAV